VSHFRIHGRAGLRKNARMDFTRTLASPELAPQALVALVFFIAGVTKGVIGLGLPTISMALLALMMAPAEAAALLIVPSLVTNIWQIGPWRTAWPLLRRLGPMQVGGCVGTLAAAWVFGAPAGAWAMVALGGALVCYAVWGLAGVQLRVQAAHEKWLGPAVGAMTGVVTAATGVFVVPAVPWLQALGLQRDELVQAMGISFTVSTLALAAGLFMTRQLPQAALGASMLLLVPALAGMYAGQLLRSRLSPKVFRTVFLGGLLVLGAHMVVHAAISSGA